MSRIVGIDFGTTNSEVAILEETGLSVKRSMGLEERFTLGDKAYSPEEIYAD